MRSQGSEELGVNELGLDGALKTVDGEDSLEEGDESQLKPCAREIPSVHRPRPQGYCTNAKARCHKGDGELELTNTLIPGLPMDQAQSCLARVPWACQTKLKRVCKTWAEYVTSNSIGAVRSEEGVLDSLLLVISVPLKGGNMRLTVFDARDITLLEWETQLAVFELPAKWSGLLRGFRCAVVGPDLFIIGGRYDGMSRAISRSVWRFNFTTNKWTEAAPMHAARRDFACAVVSGKVYVAGGTDIVRVVPRGHSAATALNSVEMYDCQHDQWHRLPPLEKGRVGCLGVALEERFYVIGGGSDHGTLGFELFRSAEVLDTTHRSWRTVDDMWQSAALIPRAAAGFQDCMFAVDSDDQRLKKYDEAANSWSDVMPLPYANVASPGRSGHAEREQAMGCLPEDQLVDLRSEGLFWMGPGSYLSRAYHLLRLRESVSGMSDDVKAHDATTASTSDEAARPGTTQCLSPRQSRWQGPEKKLCLIIGSGICYI